MARKKTNSGAVSSAAKKTGNRLPAGQMIPGPQGLLPTRETGTPESGSGAGRVDVTGIMPEDIWVDPNITEGQPGYDESGDSEIIPSQRPAGNAAKKRA